MNYTGTDKNDNQDLALTSYGADVAVKKESW